MKGYINRELCKKCGGKCCQRYPGCCFPEDFDNNEAKILEALQTGNYAVDWWEAPEPLYFIRPATKLGKEKGRLFDPSWGGECIFYTPDVGCGLPYEQRPTGCRLIEPKESGKCVDHSGGKLKAALAWKKYRKMFKTIRGSMRNRKLGTKTKI